jgi:hypothetical protein
MKRFRRLITTNHLRGHLLLIQYSALSHACKMRNLYLLLFGFGIAFPVYSHFPTFSPVYFP